MTTKPEARTLWLGIVELGLRWPKLVLLAALVITLALGALIYRAEIDTDPENMLPSDDPVRVLNRSIRADFEEGVGRLDGRRPRQASMSGGGGRKVRAPRKYDAG